jgi:hypothetical protein
MTQTKFKLIGIKKLLFPVKGLDVMGAQRPNTRAVRVLPENLDQGERPGSRGLPEAGPAHGLGFDKQRRV